MNWLTLVLFFLLATINSILMLYLILLGMAPGVSPLTFTGIFLYGPGPGFFILVAWLLVACVLQGVAWLLRLGRRRDRSSLRWNQAAWIALVLLLCLELVMLLDFWT